MPTNIIGIYTNFGFRYSVKYLFKKVSSFFLSDSFPLVTLLMLGVNIYLYYLKFTFIPTNKTYYLLSQFFCEGIALFQMVYSFSLWRRFRAESYSYAYKNYFLYCLSAWAAIFCYAVLSLKEELDFCAEIAPFTKFWLEPIFFLAYYFYFSFTRYFLKAKEIPTLFTILRRGEFAILLSVGAMILIKAGLYIEVQPALLENLESFLYQAFLGISTIISVLCMIYIFINVEQPVTWYFLMASIFLLANTVIAHYHRYIWHEPYLLNWVAFAELAVIFESIILNLGLAYSTRIEIIKTQEAIQVELALRAKIKEWEVLRGNAARKIHGTIIGTGRAVDWDVDIVKEFIANGEDITAIIQRMNETIDLLSMDFIRFKRLLIDTNNHHHQYLKVSSTNFIPYIQLLAKTRSSLGKITYLFDIQPIVHQLSFPAHHFYQMEEIIAEAFNNVRKHAFGKNHHFTGEEKVWVTLRVENNYLKISIQDNGKGFNIEELSRKGGLTYLDEMVKLIGGRFVCKSRQGEGTLLQFFIPLSEPFL